MKDITRAAIDAFDQHVNRVQREHFTAAIFMTRVGNQVQCDLILEDDALKGEIDKHLGAIGRLLIVGSKEQ